MSGHDESEALFWDLAVEVIAADEDVAEGTIMGSGCLRLRGDFLAMPHHRGPGLVVKIDADRVTELIDSGVGAAFAPAGKVFREWVLVETVDEDLWRATLAEAVNRRR